MPGDYAKHRFTQGCPGCTFAQVGVGPKRGHNEACRKRMEEEIAKDASDKRADNVKERQDHDIAQKGSGERGSQTRGDPQECDKDNEDKQAEPNEDDTNMDEYVAEGPELVDTPSKQDGQDIEDPR